MSIQHLARYTPATFALMVAIVGYFFLQVMMGVSADAPQSADLVRFGANFLPLTLANEPWRVLSAGFVHIGIMHLLFNSFALYYFGQVAERLVGAPFFVVLFLLSVMGGNVLNLAYTWQLWQATGAGIGISAGASGGIMGIGAMLTLLAFSRHPSAQYLNKRSLLMVMGINLVMGFAIDGIDNAGHIGGALTGLVLGAAVAYLPKVRWLIAGAVLAGLAGALWVLMGRAAVYL